MLGGVERYSPADISIGSIVWFATGPMKTVVTEGSSESIRVRPLTHGLTFPLVLRSHNPPAEGIYPLAFGLFDSACPTRNVSCISNLRHGGRA